MTLPLKKDKLYTYKDYIEWSNKERWELIEGVAYSMSPSPTALHQTIVLNFSNILKNKLKGKKCKPFIAPTDVVLSQHDVVQPDIFVVCDKTKIKDVINGAPDLVVEVLSPSTILKDRREKKILYEKYRVREYIIIDLVGNCVERFSIGKNGKFGFADVFGSEEVLKLSSLGKIEVSLFDVFETEE